ncbi:UDP-Glc:alpha-D-GlcNAc-diphosphoundecaprenol beta-1,3-glucosyltransferase WfgD [Vibrio aerogenes CECT 7868]|uniref:UDP-Glc:alpha-D-GlcNAc-diphosphoundecaprenol beta-1,3-glucosyltransferase WfgD n=1 Tax=Vibrio aerogenes CECT 7868 TaxID=1216006 RepID=A0A1M5ZCR9_9VIBR|nr:glycosyltransferase family 2 protein [Vibrio aerogenes]SHI22035.1 UDP-Glc:alpha-D-GlcNAc-diphosphoundecaprenol beta-1,3-glucosyltransferase WfgD [Vibrio aerogenes CECT 7868]
MINVAVIMSAYNGETYLCEQIDSILNQSYQNFQLFIRDDGSKDQTRNILSDYAEKDSRVKVSYGDNVGCIHSFLLAAQEVDADIYLFSDQDDIWMEEKIERAVAYFRQADTSVPQLYHSDLCVVDCHMQKLHDSFMQYQGLDALDSMQRKTLFLQNFVVGCSMAVNKSLLERLFIQGVPEGIAMHDWWMALIARTQGHIHFDPRPALFYRQHDNNVLGAQKRTLAIYIRALFSGQGIQRFLQFRNLAATQAESFLKTYRDYLNSEFQADLKVVSHLREKKGLSGVFRCFCSGIYLQGMVRNLALIYCAVYEHLSDLKINKSG